MGVKVLTVHIAGIDRGKERLHTAVKGSRSEVLYELNNWLFDFCYANNFPIEQLPPLDDWNQSSEDSSYHSIAFLKNLFNIWVRSELVEFKL